MLESLMLEDLNRVMIETLFGMLKIMAIPIILFLVLESIMFGLKGDYSNMNNDVMDKLKSKRDFRRRAKISRGQYKELSKMIKQYEYLQLKTREVKLKSNINRVEVNLSGILDVLNPFNLENKRTISLGNFPESYWSVRNVLCKYEISVSLIEERFFEIIEQPFNQEHEVHIRKISNEFADILLELKRDLIKAIKPFADQRDDLIGADIKGAKETIKFEKKVIERSNGNYSSSPKEKRIVSTKRSYENTNTDNQVYNPIIWNEVLTNNHDNNEHHSHHREHTDSVNYDHSSSSHSYDSSTSYDSSSSSSYDSSSSSSFDSGGSF